MTEGYPDGNPKTAFGMAKPSFNGIPPVALQHMGAAMQTGVDKYGLYNWREKPVTMSVYYNAALRHMFDFWDGQDVAPDSLVHHLGHVMANCAIMLDAIAQNTVNDDRSKFVAARLSNSAT